MRVGLFTYGMRDQLTGIGRYAVELVRALHTLALELEITLINPYPDSPLPWYQEFETYPVPQLARVPAAASLGNWVLHRASTDLELDVLHDPYGITPFLFPQQRYRRITTVHDLVPVLMPKVQPLATRLIFMTLIPAARYTADAVVTVSRASARDLKPLHEDPRSQAVRDAQRGSAPVASRRGRGGAPAGGCRRGGALHFSTSER